MFIISLCQFISEHKYEERVGYRVYDISSKKNHLVSSSLKHEYNKDSKI